MSDTIIVTDGADEAAEAVADEVEDIQEQVEEIADAQEDIAEAVEEIAAAENEEIAWHLTISNAIADLLSIQTAGFTQIMERLDLLTLNQSIAANSDSLPTIPESEPDTIVQVSTGQESPISQDSDQITPETRATTSDATMEMPPEAPPSQRTGWRFRRP